jgi:hypothetical protein
VKIGRRLAFKKDEKTLVLPSCQIVKVGAQSVPQPSSLQNSQVCSRQPSRQHSPKAKESRSLVQSIESMQSKRASLVKGYAGDQLPSQVNSFIKQVQAVQGRLLSSSKRPLSTRFMKKQLFVGSETIKTNAIRQDLQIVVPARR